MPTMFPYWFKFAHANLLSSSKPACTAVPLSHPHPHPSSPLWGSALVLSPKSASLAKHPENLTPRVFQGEGRVTSLPSPSSRGRPQTSTVETKAAVSPAQDPGPWAPETLGCGPTSQRPHHEVPHSLHTDPNTEAKGTPRQTQSHSPQPWHSHTKPRTAHAKT